MAVRREATDAVYATARGFDLKPAELVELAHRLIVKALDDGITASDFAAPPVARHVLESCDRDLSFVLLV